MFAHPPAPFILFVYYFISFIYLLWTNGNDIIIIIIVQWTRKKNTANGFRDRENRRMRYMNNSVLVSVSMNEYALMNISYSSSCSSIKRSSSVMQIWLIWTRQLPCACLHLFNKQNKWNWMRDTFAMWYHNAHFIYGDGRKKTSLKSQAHFIFGFVCVRWSKCWNYRRQIH